jgi:glyoxylase-like metal-dependent hydrolase (beta-lactamase superfamily II)
VRVQLGQWQLDSVHGGDFWLDGGVMFGVVPKTLWGKQSPPDELNRIRVACRCVLARNGRQTVLVDTGYGGKFASLDRKFYSLEAGEPLVASLASLGVAPADVDLVVFSHLHFDHAGGVTRFDAGRRPELVFPRARFIVGRLEWEDATSEAPELEGVYSNDNLRPLSESGRLELVEDATEILAGLRTRLTGGHTRGHFAIEFSSNGQAAILFGDICPSRMHLRRMWHLAYDLYPLETRRQKVALLGEAADRGAWVLWSHDPNVAASRVVRDPKREFVLAESLAQL